MPLLKRELINVVLKYLSKFIITIEDVIVIKAIIIKYNTCNIVKLLILFTNLSKKIS